MARIFYYGSSRVRVDGLKELEKNVRKLDGELRGRTYKAAILRGTRHMAARARQLAPIYTPGAEASTAFPVSPGALRRAITVAQTHEGVDNGTFWSAIVSVRSGVFHSRRKVRRLWKRLGRRRPRGADPSGTYDPDEAIRYYRWMEMENGTKYHSAQPFLRPAFEQTRLAAVGIVANSIRRSLRRYEGKGAK